MKSSFFTFTLTFIWVVFCTSAYHSNPLWNEVGSDTHEDYTCMISCMKHFKCNWDSQDFVFTNITVSSEIVENIWCSSQTLNRIFAVSNFQSEASSNLKHFGIHDLEGTKKSINLSHNYENNGTWLNFDV